MIEGGLDLSCYYQIRDYPYIKDQFAPFYTEAQPNNAAQAVFWDRYPVYLGLFDYQRPVPAGIFRIQNARAVNR